MAVQYSIREGVLTMELAGTYEPKDVVSRFLEAIAEPDCPRPAMLLVDVSRSESLATRSAADIRMVAEFLGPYAERVGGRCAVVAPSDVQFGLSQMGAVYSQGVGVSAQVFRTREDALAWLKSSPVPRG
jgi:hypothetical protein